MPRITLTPHSLSLINMAKGYIIMLGNDLQSAYHQKDFPLVTELVSVIKDLLEIVKSGNTFNFKLDFLTIDEISEIQQIYKTFIYEAVKYQVEGVYTKLENSGGEIEFITSILGELQE